MLRRLIINSSAIDHKRSIGLRVVQVSLICLFLTACSSGENQSKTESAGEIPAGSATAIVVNQEESSNKYSVFYNNTEILINAEAEEIISQIGDPESRYESPLCGMEGKDILLDYGHFDIDVFETKEEAYIYSVVFKDDLMTTEEGIFIGETEEKVLEVYGEADEQRGEALVYKDDSMELIFIIHEGIVNSIQYVSTISGI